MYNVVNGFFGISISRCIRFTSYIIIFICNNIKMFPLPKIIVLFVSDTQFAVTTPIVLQNHYGIFRY